jgi:hypothetical protein
MTSDSRAQRHREAAQRWSLKYPGRNRENIRLHRHGLRPGEEVGIYEAQQGACYLCNDPLPDDQASRQIDHDHRCPHLAKQSCGYCRRGIACRHCNLLIGYAFDDPDRLRRIADNLEAAIADVTRRLASKPVQTEFSVERK